MSKICYGILFGVISTLISLSCGRSGSQNVASDSLSVALNAVAEVQCPVDLLDGCHIDSIRISQSDSVLIVNISLSDDYVDSQSDGSDVQIWKTAVGLMLAEPRVEAILDAARKVPLSMVINLNSGVALPMQCRMSAAEFHDFTAEKLDERARDEIKVTNRVKSDNRYCPFEIEDGVTLSAMSIQDRYVTFHTMIDVEKLDFPVMKENRDSVSHAVVTSLYSQLNDSEQKKSLKEIAGARLGYRNRYVASDKSDSFDISFTPSDIERILFTSDSLEKK